MASYVPSGAARSSRMKGIKIKHMDCSCPARLKTQPPIKETQECCPPVCHLARSLVPLCRAAGGGGGAIQDGLLVVMPSDLGQRLSSSCPGFEFVPENTVRTMPRLHFCG